MSYNSGNNRASNFKIRRTRSRFEIGEARVADLEYEKPGIIPGIVKHDVPITN